MQTLCKYCICKQNKETVTQQCNFNLPVAHRFPLGFTLSFETLFLSSVKSRVIEVVKAMYEIRMKEDRSPPLQIFVTVPFISEMCFQLIWSWSIKKKISSVTLGTGSYTETGSA